MPGNRRLLKTPLKWVLIIVSVAALVFGMDALAFSRTLNGSSDSFEHRGTPIVASMVSIYLQNDQLNPLDALNLETFSGFFQAKDAINWVFRLTFSVLTTIALGAILVLLKRLSKRVRARVRQLQEKYSLALTIQNLHILPSESVEQGLLTITSLTRLLLSLLAIGIYLTILPNFFPQTEAIGRKIQSYVFGALGVFLEGIIGYFPRLITIILVGIATHYTLKFLQLIFNALENDQISIPGFYKEWIQPTYRLAQSFTLLIALALTVPNLPGFESPAFQGLSLLIGALLTLGGANTISNLIGGFIMIYTRAFQVGDRIRIGGYEGDVLEKSIMSTRIRTISNEIITVPNSNVMSSNIVNYTATLRELEEPLGLHTTVLLGYETPWRTVHKALLTAAQETPYILKEPPPVVHQSGLNGCYVTYELRAFTAQVNETHDIYSHLRRNILDQFDVNQIQTLSPEYFEITSDGHTLPTQE